MSWGSGGGLRPDGEQPASSSHTPIQLLGLHVKNRGDFPARSGEVQPDLSQTPGAVRSPGSSDTKPQAALPDLRPEELVNPSWEGALWPQKTALTLDYGAESRGVARGARGGGSGGCSVCWPLKEVPSAWGSCEHTPSWNWGSGADPGHSPKLHAVLLCAVEVWVWQHMTGAPREARAIGDGQGEAEASQGT